MINIGKKVVPVARVVPKQDLRFFDQNILKKNIFLRVTKYFIELRTKIHFMGIQRFSVMVTPHSGGKGVTLHISNYLVVFSVVVALLLLFSSTFVLSKSQRDKRNHVRLVAQNGALEAKFYKVSQTVESLSDYFAKFRSEVGSVIRVPADMASISSFNDTSLSIDSDGVATKEIVLLQKLEKELDVTKEKIFHIGSFIQSNKRVLREIPSIYPVATRARITSRFGVRRNPFDQRGYEGHDGLDLATIPGTPVYASADGIITKSGMQGGYGNLIEIQHKYGFKTRYGHLQGFASQIYPNARVKQGQVVGYIGATGRVTGYHLHYEVLIGNLRVDPEPFAMMLR